MAEKNEMQYPGRKNFSGPKGSKSGFGVAPKASGSPWSGGRPVDAGHSRRASQPSKPSDSRPSSLFGRKEQSGN